MKGGIKMIKVHIRRQVPPEKLADLYELIQQLRAMTMGQPGYIAGETLKRVDAPGESLVVSKWSSVDSWQKWRQSRQRAEIQERIDSLLGRETRYEIYEYD